MKNILGDFNANVGREDIFKQTIGQEGLHEITYECFHIATFINTLEFMTGRHTTKCITS
jgi:hypothetical protein